MKFHSFYFVAFRCAYCNYFNGARKHKPVFNLNLLNSPPQPQNGSNNPERMEMSVTDSSDSNEAVNESRVTRRSIRVPTTNNNGGMSHNPILSSSEESLSDKTK